NWSNGIDIIGSAATGNLVEQNYIGTDASETNKLGNKGHGIWMKASRDTIGGISLTRRNVIAFNDSVGVRVDSGNGNLIRYNSIVGNRQMGIDLGVVGVTPNDSLDGDTGANDRQNFPILDSAVVVGLTTKIYGRIDSKPNQRYTLDFFSNDSADASHFGEGKTFLRDTLDVRCDATGRAQFMVTVPVPLDTSRRLTATATDSLGNTSEFSRALCFADADSDGIFDDWEASGNGIDVNCDGIIDLDLNTLGAKPDHKDIFVEVDAMTGYGPLPGVLDSVIAAFGRVPDGLLHNPDGQGGIKLHIDPLQDNTIAVRNFPNEFIDFDSVKRVYFGSPTQRANANSRYILEAKRLVYHYCLFARTYGTTTGDTASTGLARGILSNDFMVTLGSTGPIGWNGGSDSIQMGTFMHELGHTLGLGHGGGDDTPFKPNYYSVMNYTWQLPLRPPSWQVPGSWSLDYSRSHLPDLNESALDERTGLGPPWNTYRIVSVPYSDSVRNIKQARLRSAWPADWNGFYSIESRPVAVDINRIRSSDPASPGDTLRGYSDWQNLKFNFRSAVDVNASPFSSPSDIGQELTRAMYEELRALPPPRPSGSFIMDGQLDSSATLLTSNSGINLYTAMSGPQLYVATDSAQTQGADMFIFIAVSPGALQAAPWLKSGQVAAWSAVLGNESTDNSTVWYNGSSLDLFAITVDTAGTVLEGVVDLEYLTGVSPPTVYLAVGKYETDNGGVLLVQAPVGNGDENINANEFIALETALPIQLASFTATPLPNAHVRLDWVTLSEVNNYGFEIQRKRASDPDFQTLPNSFVPGHGTTNEPHSYSFIDTTVSSGQWSYRLKQIDLDGTIHYGPEVVVDLLTGVEEGSLPTVFALYQNFPNPFNPTTAIRFDVPRLSHVNLTVYNVLGQEVMTLVNETRKPGKYEALFNASSLSSGVYFYKLKTNSYVSTKKMVLTK
ncbi:MAG: T9SS type A sorting domain-containing protein, partial [Bacteroidota bacterium]